MIAWRQDLPRAGRKDKPMAGDEQNSPGSVPGLVGDFLAQLRGITEGLEGLARERLPPMPGAFPLPGTLSAAQMASIADSIAAQRRSIDALRTQLSAFDEQLAALEQILGPLAQWSGKWAELEERLLNMGPWPPAGGRPSGQGSGEAGSR
jgi:hypothetical protein